MSGESISDCKGNILIVNLGFSSMQISWKMFCLKVRVFKALNKVLKNLHTIAA